LLTCNLDWSSSYSTANYTAWPWYVQCFSTTVSYRDSALVTLPEAIILEKDHNPQDNILVAGLEKYASFAEHSNVMKAVDEALCVEKEGLDHARLGKALLQIAVNNSFSVHS
jgi:hypothetical protein